MSWLAVGIVLPWLAVLVGCLVGYQILLQRRRILDRLDGVEDDVRDELDVDGPAEMRIGNQAPVFELPDLDGQPVSLRDFLGRRVLMIFVGPLCKFSRQLFPGLATLPLDGRDGRPELLLVSKGTAEENREFVEEFGLKCKVMLQEDWKVASGAYGINGSPMGYLLDAEGAIASRLGIGHEALLELARSVVSESPGGERRGRRSSRGKVRGTSSRSA